MVFINSLRLFIDTKLIGFSIEIIYFLLDLFAAHLTSKIVFLLHFYSVAIKNSEFCVLYKLGNIKLIFFDGL